MTDTVFTARKLVDTIGISYRQLDHWTTTKVIEPSITNNKGSGNRREFSGDDVLYIRLIKDLLDQGYDLRYLRTIGSQIRKSLTKIVSGHVLVISGKDVKTMNHSDATAMMSKPDIRITVCSITKTKPQKEETK
jgi:DNA-binding transcriptional MerR regulator